MPQNVRPSLPLSNAFAGKKWRKISPIGYVYLVYPPSNVHIDHYASSRWAGDQLWTNNRQDQEKHRIPTIFAYTDVQKELKN